MDKFNTLKQLGEIVDARGAIVEKKDFFFLSLCRSQVAGETRSHMLTADSVEDFEYGQMLPVAIIESLSREAIEAAGTNLVIVVAGEPMIVAKEALKSLMQMANVNGKRPSLVRDIAIAKGLFDRANSSKRQKTHFIYKTSGGHKYLIGMVCAHVPLKTQLDAVLTAAPAEFIGGVVTPKNIQLNFADRTDDIHPAVSVVLSDNGYASPHIVSGYMKNGRFCCILDRKILGRWTTYDDIVAGLRETELPSPALLEREFNGGEYVRGTLQDKNAKNLTVATREIIGLGEGATSVHELFTAMAESPHETFADVLSSEGQLLAIGSAVAA